MQQQSTKLAQFRAEVKEKTAEIEQRTSRELAVRKLKDYLLQEKMLARKKVISDKVARDRKRLEKKSKEKNQITCETQTSPLLTDPVDKAQPVAAPLT